MSGNKGTTGAADPAEGNRRRSIEEIKAEARAHALSSTTTSKKSKQSTAWSKKRPPPPPSVQTKRNASGTGTASSAAAATAVPPPGYPPPPLYPYPPPPHMPPPPPVGADGKKSSGEAAVAAMPYPYGYPYAPPGYYPGYAYPPPPPGAYHHWHQHHMAAYSAASAKESATAGATGAGAAAAAGTASANLAGGVSSASATESLAVVRPPAQPPQVTAANLLNDPNIDDYTKFVKAMQMKDWWELFVEDDDNEEEDYKEDEDKEEEEEEDDEDEEENEGEEKETKTDQKPAADTGAAVEPAMDLATLDLSEDESLIYKELREELGWLEEEDMEAAVATLLQDTKPAHDNNPSHSFPKSPGPPGTPAADGASGTWANQLNSLRGSAKGIGNAKKTQLTAEQYALLADLIKKYYQLLIQQAVLAIRAAHAQKYQNRILTRVAASIDGDEDDSAKKAKYQASFWMGHETGDELVECLDGAIGMLQDLNENRKDAIRHFVQSSQGTLAERRLTRAQFEKSLKELSQGAARTLFDIPGITNLNDTFALIDKSVQAEEDSSDDDNKQNGNSGEREELFLLETDSVEEACKFVLDRAKASYDTSVVPGARDLSHNFSDVREYCGDKFKEPCNSEQELLFRRNRNLFTAGEDNLVLRGVNLYGEKQWILIADRFLPERSIHIISQRYSKLCMMIYIANGIKIDQDGKLEKPASCEVMTQKQKDFLKTLKPLEPPAILNVHRWSLLEDMMLLKAVPILGNSWAKLGTYLIPYRDRGHLRKRYQVLERRVKSTMSRSNRKDFLDALNLRSPTRVRSPPSKSQPRAETTSRARTQTTFASPPRRPPKPPTYSTPQRAQAMAPPPYSPYPYSPYAYPYPYQPAMYPPAYPPPPYAPPADESSRAAFERLAQESRGEWSQMAYMQSIMSPQNTPVPRETTAVAEKGKGDKVTGGGKQRTSLLSDVLEKSKGDSNDAEEKKMPDTPDVKGTVYSTHGSPIGLTDPFRSPQTDVAESKLLGSPHLPSGTMQSFPATSRLTHSDGSSESQPQTEMGSSPHETSLDSFRTYNSNYSRGRSVRPLFGDGSTLMETDLEAVSALNILSNSPALSLQGKRKAQSADEETRAQPKSLFAAVVGNKNKKQKKE